METEFILRRVTVFQCMHTQLGSFHPIFLRTKQRDVRANLFFCLINPLSFWRSRCRRRRRS